MAQGCARGSSGTLWVRSCLALGIPRPPENRREAWKLWDESGLEITESPTVVSLEEQEETVLLLVAKYAEAYFPALIEHLKLTGVLSQLASE